MSRHNPPRAVCRFAGFTLIELMIAMLLGLIVIAGVTSVFLAGQQSFRTNNALSDVQDSSRVAFELMARDIRDAGLTGCANQGHIVNVLNNQGTAWWANWANAAHGYDNSDADPAVTIGTAAKQRVDGTDSVQLIGAANSSYSVKEPGESSSDTFTFNESGATLQSGDIVLVCDPGQAAIMQAGTWNAAASTFDYDAGGSTPGNNSINIDYIGFDVPTPRSFGANSQVALYDAFDWYVGNNDAGGKSLYRIGLENEAGAPTPTPQEMVRNVTDMQITYLAPGDTSHPGTFESAATITADDAWTLVSAVRVELTLQSTFQRASVKGDAPISRKYSFTTTLRNRVD